MTSRFNNTDFARFLVIQTASIGDVILATPVIEKLHLHYPNAAIDVMIKQGNESLFEGHPFINRLLIWNKSERKYRNFYALLAQVRKQKYDAVINLQRFAATGLITVLSGAGYRAGFNKNPFSIFFTHLTRHTIKDGNRHEVERNLSLAEAITDKSQIKPKLYPTSGHDALMSQYKTVKYITISPASLWFTKQFPEAKWIEFLGKVDEGIRVYLLGSKNDRQICEYIGNSAGHNNLMVLAGKLSLLESASLMKDAVMNFMNDSAPMHLASAMNGPTTVIYCSTVPDFGFGPLADDSVIVQTDENLSCRPCGLHGFVKCPEKHFNCALTIDTNKLIKRID